MKNRILTLIALIAGLIIWIAYANPNNFQTGNVVLQINDTSPVLESNKYSGFYWDHMPLTYNYSNEGECYAIRVNRTQYAMQEIERLTDNQVSFVKTDAKADISFVCSRTSLVNINDRTETLGEAEVEYQPDTKKIISAKINLYSGVPKDCEYPDVEMHEILHALGFQHNIHTQSVMNVIQQRCLDGVNMNVDGVIFEKLKAIY